ncbi:MAG: ABC transporter substrate-binding protein [Pseudanabaena sp. Salubria-1]|nr:ABC transporter substrate-binding protein [Pseudanabaena sp. Salubria-1]
MANNKKEVLVLGLTLAIFGSLAVVGVLFFGKSKLPIALDSNPTDISSNPNFDLATRKSEGEKLLIAAETNADKAQAIAAIAKKDYATAVSKWEASLSKQRSDPEALIYLNNAKIGEQKSLTIAVSVPIGGNLNVAKEILRGVAQAQTEVNSQGGINAVPLKIVIVNDDNKIEVGKKVAQALAQDQSILAVIGHNSSEVSIAAAPTYQAGGLVMMSSTSIAKELSGLGSYIFRTVPSVRFQADALSQYAVKKQNKKNIGICLNSTAKASQSIKEDFTAAVFSDGAKISRVNCDLSSPDFNADQVIQEMLNDRVDALLLSPGVEKIEKGVEVAVIARNRLLLLANSTMYTFKTLQLGQGAIADMVITVPWHPEFLLNNPFAGNAVKLWGGDVNWRSATSYDATLAIAGGLRKNSTRAGLQQTLSSNTFELEGAAGKIAFQPSGDRANPAILVKVSKGDRAGVGYDFVPLR